MVLRVSGGELAAARSQMGQCAEVLSGVRLDRGSQAVFGVAVLASAAAGFCSDCEWARHKYRQASPTEQFHRHS